MSCMKTYPVLKATKNDRSSIVPSSPSPTVKAKTIDRKIEKEHEKQIEPPRTCKYKSSSSGSSPSLSPPSSAYDHGNKKRIPVKFQRVLRRFTCITNSQNNKSLLSSSQHQVKSQSQSCVRNTSGTSRDLSRALSSSSSSSLSLTLPSSPTVAYRLGQGINHEAALTQSNSSISNSCCSCSCNSSGSTSSSMEVAHSECDGRLREPPLKLQNNPQFILIPSNTPKHRVSSSSSSSQFSDDRYSYNLAAKLIPSPWNTINNSFHNGKSNNSTTIPNNDRNRVHENVSTPTLESKAIPIVTSSTIINHHHHTKTATDPSTTNHHHRYHRQSIYPPTPNTYCHHHHHYHDTRNLETIRWNNQGVEAFRKGMPSLARSYFRNANRRWKRSLLVQAAPHDISLVAARQDDNDADTNDNDNDNDGGKDGSCGCMDDDLPFRTRRTHRHHHLTDNMTVPLDKGGVTTNDSAIGTIDGSVRDKGREGIRRTRKDETDTSTQGYMYQRMDFDEGMYAFLHVEPLHYQKHTTTITTTNNNTINNNVGNNINNKFKTISSSSCSNVILPTLWFNRSQTHTQLHEWSRAIECLEMGLGEVHAVLSPPPPTTEDYIDYDDASSSCCSHNLIYIHICILINLGQLQYRGGDLTNSSATYSCALHMSEQFQRQCGSDDNDMNSVTGSILNCLGVLQYHILSILSSSSSAITSSLVSPRRRPTNDIRSNKLSSNDIAMSIQNHNRDDDDTTPSIPISSGSLTFQKSLHYFQKSLTYLNTSTNTNPHEKSNLHPHPTLTGTIHNNLGRLHVLYNNDNISALQSYNISLTIRATTLGTDSLDYAATAFNKGQSCHQIGRFEEALPLYRCFLEVGVRVLPPHHRDVAVVLSGIAQIMQQMRGSGGSDKQNGDDDNDDNDDGEYYNTVLDLYRRSLASAKVAFGGEKHIEMAMILNRLGNFHFEMGDFKEASDAYRRGLEIERKVLKEEHGNIVITLCNLGEIYRKTREWDRAVVCYEEVLWIQRNKRRKRRGGKSDCDNDYNNDDDDGYGDKEIGATLHLLGISCDRKGDANLALHYFQSALLLRRSVFGDKHPGVVSTLTSLGSFLFRGKKFHMALEVFQEALDIRLSILGRDHRHVALSFYNIALVLQKQGSYREAVVVLGETLRVERLVLGGDHRDVAITLCRLGEVSRDNNNLGKALEYFGEAVEIQKKVLACAGAGVATANGGRRRVGRSEKGTIAIAKIVNEIGNIHLGNGDISSMMEAFVESARLYQTTTLSANTVVVRDYLYGLDVCCQQKAPAA